jgi:hypothetical protein
MGQNISPIRETLYTIATPIESGGSLPVVNQMPRQVVNQSGRDKLFLSDIERKALGLGFVASYGHLPIELFQTKDGNFVFDAKNVCFLKLNHVAFDLLTILRDRAATLEELFRLLPQHLESEIRRAYQDLLDAQADDLLIRTARIVFRSRCVRLVVCRNPRLLISAIKLPLAATRPPL